MFWGIAILVMFLLYITAKGELPIYMSFFRPQPNTSDNSAAINGAAAGSSVPLMPGVPVATGLPSQETIPFTGIPGAGLSG